MSLTYGFYNSVDGDRVYDATQFGSIFDGVINDGVYATIGDKFIVNASGNNMAITVGSGRAWFNHTWNYNDTELVFTVEAPELLLDRIDALVLEIDTRVSNRQNSIKFVKGTPSSAPSRPTMQRSDGVYQYPLCYIFVAAGATIITQSVVTNTVGTSECPFVTGVLEYITTDELIKQWTDQWTQYVLSYEREASTWTNAQKVSFEAYKDEFETQLNEFESSFETSMSTFQSRSISTFNNWFDNLVYTLDGDVAGHLQNEIDDILDNGLGGSVITITTTSQSLQNRDVVLQGDKYTKTGSFDGEGRCVIRGFMDTGEVTITSTDLVQTATLNVNIPYFGDYDYDLEFWVARVHVSTSSSEFYGRDIVIRDADDHIVNTIAFNDSGEAIYSFGTPGTYSFNVTYNDNVYNETVVVSEETDYYVELNPWMATVSILTESEAFYGLDVTITSPVLSRDVIKTFDNAGAASYVAYKPGVYTFSVTYTEGDTMATITESLTINAEGFYTVELNLVPDGATKTPVNDVQIWLHCAGIYNKDYTTIEQVLNDSSTLNALISSANAVDYLVRCESFHGKVDLIPDSITASNYDSNAQYVTLNGTTENDRGARYNHTEIINDNTYGMITYQFNKPVCARYVEAYLGNYLESNELTCGIQASNNNNTWIDLGNDVVVTGHASGTYGKYDFIFENNTTSYTYYRFNVKTMKVSGTNLFVYELHYYDKKPGTYITDNEKAMSYIGLNNYCSNTLLANTNWLRAICGSEYFESVLNVKVPTMTSRTTPTGEVIGTSSASDWTGISIHIAFDGIFESRDESASTGFKATDSWIGYDFGDSVRIYMLSFENEYSTPVYVGNFLIESSHNQIDWFTEGSFRNLAQGTPGAWTKYVITTQKSNRCWRLHNKTVGVESSLGYGWTILEMQFYGRKDV